MNLPAALLYDCIFSWKKDSTVRTQNSRHRLQVGMVSCDTQLCCMRVPFPNRSRPCARIQSLSQNSMSHFYASNMFSVSNQSPKMPMGHIRAANVWNESHWSSGTLYLVSWHHMRIWRRVIRLALQLEGQIFLVCFGRDLVPCVFPV